jgi:hypothetical protein
MEEIPEASASVDRRSADVKIDLPLRLDTRAAFRVYVTGRSRSLDPEEKRAAAGCPPPENVGGTLPAGTGESHPSREPCFGVPVPQQLEFQRNAGTWRSRLPGGRLRPGRSPV